VTCVLAPSAGREWVELSPNPLPVDTATRWATTPAAGAVVTFLGVTREQSEGRTGVQALTYEAYAGEAVRRMEEIAAAARDRWPAVERLVLLHRTGEVALSEPSVVVVASSPHRAEAFEAAQFCIDTLKETVPIWKREHWEGGSDWAESTRPVQPVRQPTRSG
jgi:molybdopterin synthase catalytic subunit